VSDERVRKLLKEIEDELAGTDRTLADVIRERLRIRPEDETARVRDLIGGRLVMNEPIVHQVLVTILHGGSTEAALVAAVKYLAESLRLQVNELADALLRAPPRGFRFQVPAYGTALPGSVVADAEAFLRSAPVQTPRDYMTLHDGNRSTPGDDL